MDLFFVVEKFIFYIYVDIKNLVMKERIWLWSLLNWIIIDENGYFLLILFCNYDVVIFGFLKWKIGIVNFIVFFEIKNCISEEFDIFFRKLMLSLIWKMKYNNKVYYICCCIFF